MRAMTKNRILVLHDRIKVLRKGLIVKNSYLYNSYKQRIRDAYEEITFLRELYFYQYAAYPENDKT